MKRFSSTTLKTAFVKSIPIFCSYVFVSMAYGMMMASAGFPWYDSLLVSLTVYTGAFQFVLITFLSSGASLITIALTALLMNSRQSFYSITFLKEFKQMGRRKLYMIHTMTDETYAVNCTLDLPKKEKEDTMFLVALFSRCYWIVGSVLGGILGQIVPFDLTGLDFCMTALFLIIFIDQWEKQRSTRCRCLRSDHLRTPCTPVSCISGSRKMPASLERLGQALPSAIMAVLIIYCMKDIPTGGISAAVPKLLAAAVVFITYKWKHQTLVSILLGTISYMMLLRLF